MYRFSKEHIRKAKINDLPNIIDIYNSTIKLKNVTATIEPINLNDRLEWFQKHSTNEKPLWVLEYENKIIAWFSLSDFHPREAYNITKEVSIYIDQGYRAQGIGYDILKYIIEYSRSINIENLVALIFQENIKSIKLFKKSGFNEWGLLPNVAKNEITYLSLVILGINL